eukprot:CAMPEP_0196809660 /NCGR_PEP_ID=MMETSP1362-20130617/9577_1 /TAXON_ID=163516 /ORGANISM="Leptocylindrus danicus, Strain CCMP1856" /LENGTH=346 /DNA_ID=CAMNT_0042184415 /DNA_START=29 /DNA_END=1069 /DNA_ORIENTATION=-
MMKKGKSTRQSILSAKHYVCKFFIASFVALLFFNLAEYDKALGAKYDDHFSSIYGILDGDANISAERSHRFERYNYVPPIATSNLAVKKEYEEFVEKQCDGAPVFDSYFKLSPRERSANGEDRLIYDLFFRDHSIEDKGTFVEMGAYDGKTESNTRFFEYCLGWRGLLVEANPYKYPLLYRNRPHAHKMGYAPSCSLEEEKAGKTVMFHDYPSTNAGLVGAAKTYDGRHKVPIPCGSLTPVLLDLFSDTAQHIHFFSLDVEGSEPSVLENIDFKKVYIEVLMVEVRNQQCRADCESRDQTRAIMQKEGYIIHSGLVPKSDIFVHSRSSLAKYTTDELNDKRKNATH